MAPDASVTLAVIITGGRPRGAEAVSDDFTRLLIDIVTIDRSKSFCLRQTYTFTLYRILGGNPVGVLDSLQLIEHQEVC